MLDFQHSVSISVIVAVAVVVAVSVKTVSMQAVYAVAAGPVHGNSAAGPAGRA